jgi:pimeloyl-ACP methyl ester carboxylesterase
MEFWAIASSVLGAFVLLVCFLTGYLVMTTRRITAAAEKLAPATGQFVTVGGNRIHYMEQGEGRPILFIHGLGGQLHHFKHPLFDAFGPGYRLISIDRPGSGYSVRRNGDSGGLHEQAAVIAGFIKALKLDRPLLVGHSLGGAVALATAVDHPRAISGLALVSPLTHLEKAIPPAFRALHIRSNLLRQMLAQTVAVPLSLRLSPNTLALVFGPQQPPKDYPIVGGGLSGMRPSHLYATASDFVAIPNDLGKLEARYHEIRMPVGILFGTADRVLDHRRHGLAMAGKIPGLDLEILEGVGHMPQYAAQERVIGFVKRIAGRAFAR